MTSVSDRLFVATRKGLFTVVRKSRRWTIDRLEFAGMPVSAVLEDPRDGWHVDCRDRPIGGDGDGRPPTRE